MTIQALIDKVTELPTLPDILLKIDSAIQNESTDVGKLGRLIEKDQSLTTNLLRFANSAYYGLSHRVDTVEKAVVVLGFNTLQHFVVGASVLTLMSQSKSQFFKAKELWYHSLSCAIAAKLLMNKAGAFFCSKVFTCGLIHDIGKVIIASHLPNEMEEIIRQLQSSGTESEIDIEKEVLGFTHAHVGGMLVRKWRLPTDYSETTQFHHLPQAGNNDERPVMLLRYSVYMGNQIVKALGLGRSTDEKVRQIDPVAWETLGIRENDLPYILNQIKEEFNLSANLWVLD